MSQPPHEIEPSNSDSAGVNALLDSLRTSPHFTSLMEEQKRPPSTFNPLISNGSPLMASQASSSSASQESTSRPSLSARISSLLSSLVSTPPLPPLPTPSTSFWSQPQQPPPSSFEPSPTELRAMSYQKSLSHLGRLLENPETLESLKKIKQKQDDMETRLWNGRIDLIQQQKKRVTDVQQKAKIVGAPPTSREIETLSITFSRELEKYDRERVMVAWDDLIYNQQAALERLGFPTMFVTDNPVDLERQQRVAEVISNAL